MTTDKGNMHMNIEIRKVEKEELLGSLFNQLKEVYAEFFKTTSSSFSSNYQQELKERLASKEFQEHWFIAFDRGTIVGFSLLNPKHRYFDVFSLPNNNQIDRDLLKLVIKKAREMGILQIQTSTFSKQNWDLVEAFGGKVLNSSTERMLDLNNFNREIAQNWLNIKKEEWLVKRYNNVSNELIDEIGDLSFEVSNEVLSMDGLETNNDKAGHIEWLRKLDGYAETSGYNYIIFTISQKEDGVLGFIEGSLYNSEPDFFLQRLVAVKKDQRGKGLGKYMKALMLFELRSNHPQVVKLKTANNDINFPAVAINQKLGFEIIGTYKDLCIDITKLSKLWR